ncbi:hypothetical protein FH972_022628 [Carpinus fangiana]|uniref:Uncharacterized protein n=1 Tax=Carpinus fangiana TaxID=176857 RepID=A0A5N6KSS2_9ROSI|nr:hypothetical protein FH972_022628 [Carpinus fangiana]
MDQDDSPVAIEEEFLRELDRHLQHLHAHCITVSNYARRALHMNISDGASLRQYHAQAKAFTAQAENFRQLLRPQQPAHARTKRQASQEPFQSSPTSARPGKRQRLSAGGSSATPAEFETRFDDFQDEVMLRLERLEREREARRVVVEAQDVEMGAFQQALAGSSNGRRSSRAQEAGRSGARADPRIKRAADADSPGGVEESPKRRRATRNVAE